MRSARAACLLLELHLALGGRLLQPQQALVLGQQTLALPDPAHAPSGYLKALQAQLLLDPQRTVAGMDECVVEHGLLDLGRDPVGMRSAWSGQPVDQPFGTIGLEVAADLVELLAGVTHQLAGAADIGEVGGQLQQRELATCYLVLGGHDRLPFRFDWTCGNAIQTRSKAARPPEPGAWTLAVRARFFGGLLSGDYDLRT